ncbi:adenylate/guanylate cyclase domain-containing protein [Legionella genomosp. 1]|uniref:adenylate/guanylate cyclase domain-containing protein n=1 Tax=Legionella genomosp. 1 TaxID=1093625 RepID=UPI0010545CB3|nr:adenylate/guanylate cyclase domain-containing protein [Legionella genomosp. 1]
MLVFLLRTVSLVLLLVRVALFAAILLFLIPYLKQWKPEWANNQYVAALEKIEQPISKPIDSVITKVVPPNKEHDLTGLIKIIVFLILLSNIKYLHKRIKRYSYYLKQKKDLLAWRSQNKIARNSSLYLALEEKLEQINSTKNKRVSRKLYQEFMALKKKLEAMSRYFAFLSIDVVNSTGMKTKEDRSLIQLDFLRFKKMVQKNLDENGCVKSAWTPDGVMACFNTVDNAVNAAQASIIQLEHFNEKVKQISRDFAVRCGIHAGVIYYDERLPLEEITDQVIDIAGHMQKHAEPGTIAISKTSIKPSEDTSGFVSNGKTVDDYEVYQWSAKKGQSTSAFAANGADFPP